MACEGFSFGGGDERSKSRPLFGTQPKFVHNSTGTGFLLRRTVFARESFSAVLLPLQDRYYHAPKS
jgi:hypothetical protein